MKGNKIVVILVVGLFLLCTVGCKSNKTIDNESTQVVKSTSAEIFQSASTSTVEVVNEPAATIESTSTESTKNSDYLVATATEGYLGNDTIGYVKVPEGYSYYTGDYKAGTNYSAHSRITPEVPTISISFSILGDTDLSLKEYMQKCVDENITSLFSGFESLNLDGINALKFKGKCCEYFLRSVSLKRDKKVVELKVFNSNYLDESQHFRAISEQDAKLLDAEADRIATEMSDSYRTTK